MAEEIKKEDKNMPEIKQDDMVLNEFDLMLNELLDQFRVGEKGKVIIPVEVIRVGKDRVRFRKSGEAEVQGKFDQLTVAEMRDNLDVAER